MLIALLGKIKSGKSTAANNLVKAGWTKVNFKDALVKEIKKNFPLLLKEISIKSGVEEKDLFDIKPPLLRRLMQEYGTDVRRTDALDYWTNRWHMNVNNCGGDNIVVDDCRFENEAKAVRDFGGYIIRIERPDAEVVDTHLSETEMDKVTPDYILQNDGTEQDLINSLHALIREI